MSIDWNSIGIGCAVTVVTHPFAYVKVLVQLGHEPLPPIVRRNLFFRKQLQYPSVFEYLKHIKRIDGYFGLYRGLGPRICANATTSLSYNIVSNAIKRDSEGKLGERERPPNPGDISMEWTNVCKQTAVDMTARCAAVVISQPFHVIAIRTMAQFVGRETTYSNIYRSTVEIYVNEGILGFFSGLPPRLANEIFSLWLCSLLAYAVNRCILNDSSDLRDLRPYTRMLISFFAQTITYPLSVTGTVMAANGANIMAGKPPFVPHYSNWLSCLKDLHEQGLKDRGSSLFFRKAAAHLYAAASVNPVPASAI